VNQNEFETFSQAYETAWSFHKQITPQAISMAFDLLKDHSINNVLGGLKAHCLDPVRGQFPPKPADIIAQIERRMPQRVSADEAWTMLPHDESDTVVWTDEMAEAYSIAKKEPDSTASRMAFRSAYDRIVERNKVQGIRPKWIYSVGWDTEKRCIALQAAIKQGRISASDVDPLLLESPTGSLAGLLEAHSNFDEEKAKENLCKLKKMLTGQVA
jgi:hypothetical protein